MKQLLPKMLRALIICVSCFTITNAQEKACATMYADSMLRSQDPTMGSFDDFENWLQEKIAEAEKNKGNTKMQQIYTLPVIVHVIHAGEALGSGRNISDAQVNSQITVLNQDFRKTNSDISGVPTAWTSTAADCEINFCMAQKDLSGATMPTPGIERINAVGFGFNAPPYTISYFENSIKPVTIWDANKYFNIWVADISDPSVGGTLLGWSTFPPNSGLSGIQSSSTGSIYNDGVVIWYKAFGTTGTAQSPNNKGRTTTHEVGHWLGLRHTWGDDSGTCTGTDYCNDTPNQSGSQGGCPAYPKTDACSPSAPGTMFMNYMNYVNDACMYMFTNDQKTRVQTVMANSTMRKNVAQQANCVGTAIEENITHPFSVYPNPAKEKLYIDMAVNTTEPVEVRIFGMLGNIVMQNIYKPSSTKFNIDISSYSEGVYFVEVRNSGETYLKKIVIAR